MYSWGIIFIIIGSIMLVNTLFGLNIPIIRLLIASVFIYYGLSMLSSNQCSFGRCSFQWKSHVHKMTAQGQEKYRINFESTTIDLRSLETVTERKKINIKAHCSHLTLLIPKNIRTVLHNHALFSQVTLSPLFHPTETNHQFENFSEGQPLLKISLDGAFNTFVIQDV